MTEFPGLHHLLILWSLCATFGAISSGQVVPQHDAYSSAMERGSVARKQGAFQDALHEFEIAIKAASEAHNLRDEAVAMNRESACFIRLFQYRQALAVANAAADLGKALRDDEIQGISANNRATIYEQLGDFTLAENAAREAVSHFSVSGNKDFYAVALTNYGDILAFSGNTEAAMPQFRQAIALSSGDAKMNGLEALAQDRMGEALQDDGDFAAAAAPLERAYQLYRATGDHTSASLTTFELAVLARLRGDYRGALKILDSVHSSHDLSLGALTPFSEPKLRGECLLGLHREREALQQFDRAVAIAAQWRRASLPSDASSTKTLVLLHDVYQDYISLAADLSIREHSSALTRRALSVLMDHRASTLREQMVATLGRQMTLPPRYFELLNQIQLAQAAVTLGSAKNLPTKRAALQQLQTELVEVENNVGLNGSGLRETEMQAASSQTVARVQRRLRHEELLLSFFLGKERSYVWAVTNDKVGVYQLPSETVIAAHSKAFSQAARAGHPESTGETLRQDLLARLDPEFQSRPDWIIAADGALLDAVPFSALPEGLAGLGPLANSHSLRFTPSELLLAQTPQPARNTRFLGVADPIYNLADSRLAGTQRPARTKLRSQPGITLARLVASEREVHLATAGLGFDRVDVLSGNGANAQKLREQLATPPEVLHFAVHVISPENPDGGMQSDEAALALTLGPDGLPQLLTKEFISTLRVPGTLVVLSGCASQQGRPLPSAGLIGLSRAWLLAGASAVLVTAWPTPDDSGTFFGSFYGHLQASAVEGNIARRAAEALQAAQLDMQHSRGYESAPSFWAAYSLISKE